MFIHKKHMLFTFILLFVSHTKASKASSSHTKGSVTTVSSITSSSSPTTVTTYFLVPIVGGMCIPLDSRHIAEPSFPNAFTQFEKPQKGKKYE